jgi:hypothetical protein
MKTGFHGTFVVSWSQTELDGQWSAPVDALRVGAGWSWSGEAVRVDGPAGILPLGDAAGEADLRRRAAQSVRGMLRTLDAERDIPPRPESEPPLFEQCFTVTDGRAAWTVTLIRTAQEGQPLLMFIGEIPPRHVDLWIVSHNIDLAARNQTSDTGGGVICFTPGTRIRAEHGLIPVEELTEGCRVQTKDNGLQEILWIGGRRMSGARLHAMPHLCPIRLTAGALDDGVPDESLLVSPDHRMLLRGPRALALFNTQEVLVTARDLIDDQSVFVQTGLREVTYIHLLLPTHEVVFANGVETESFHPASAEMATMPPEDKARMFARLPELSLDSQAYGPYARRVLSDSEAAILRHDHNRGGRA